MSKVIMTAMGGATIVIRGYRVGYTMYGTSNNPGYYRGYKKLIDPLSNPYTHLRFYSRLCSHAV